MVLETLARVGEEVHKGTLLHKVVFLVDAHILDLLFGLLKVLHLGLLTGVSPLASELLGLVESVGVVEVGELGSEHEGEVSDLHVANEPAHQELVVPDHAANPLVVGPPSESGQRSDGTDVEEQEDETTSAPGQGLVVGGHLLWADGLEESLHVVVVGEENWVSFRVVWMLVAVSHLGKFSRVVVSAVLLHVLGLGSKNTHIVNNLTRSAALLTGLSALPASALFS